MNLSKEQYKEYAKKNAEKSPIFKDCLMAFLFGGLICAIAQGFFILYTNVGIGEKEVKILTPSTIIFITALLTGIGVFDKIAKRAGAGTLVPISGFANAVVSEAMDCRADECDIIGLSRKAP